MVAFFAWLSAGFLVRKDFRVDLTEAYLVEVCRIALFFPPPLPSSLVHVVFDVDSVFE